MSFLRVTINFTGKVNFNHLVLNRLNTLSSSIRENESQDAAEMLRRFYHKSRKT